MTNSEETETKTPILVISRFNSILPILFVSIVTGLGVGTIDLFAQGSDQAAVSKREVVSRIVDRNGAEIDRSLTGRFGYIYEQVRREATEIIGMDEFDLGGFLIEATVDSDLQTVATDAMLDQVAAVEKHPEFSGQTLADYQEIKEKHRGSSSITRLPAPKYLQSAMILVDNETGAVLAKVGGRDFQDSMFDRSEMGRFTAGTIFTPFVFAAAFEKGFFPGTILSDTPMSSKKVMLGGLSGNLGEWGAEDVNHRYEKTVTAREALAKGKNAATIRIGEKAGLQNIVALAETAGLTFFGDLKKFNATMLGRNSSSLSEIAKAYSIFPRQGATLKSTPIISRIRDAKGKIVYKNPAGESAGKAVDRYTAFQINSLLVDSFKTGTAKKAREIYGLGDYPVAGKTGTTSGFTDNWFAGYTSRVTCVAWIGFDQRREIYSNAFSSETVLPAWVKIMNAAAKITNPQPFQPPSDAVKVEICTDSGELACEKCQETSVEFLRPGSSLKACHIHEPGL